MIFNLKKARGSVTPCGFSKNMLSRDRESFVVTFNFIISHAFSENFNEIPTVIQKIWRFSPSILTNCSDDGSI